MKVLILMSSPLKTGNTATLLEPFLKELKENRVKVEYVELYEKEIKGCIDCRMCQKVLNEPNCSINDDMQDILISMLRSDVIIIATPVFTWSFTAPAKAVLDRMFSLSKYYGSLGEKKSLLLGKK